MKHALKITLFYLAMFVALGLFWFWIAKPSDALISLPKDVKLQCLSYAPFGKDDSPFNIAKGFRPSVELMDRDLEHLSKLTNCIRTYSSVGLEALPDIARKHGLRLWLGAWISADPVTTKKEIDTTIALAKKNKDIVETVVVGNEALLRRDVSAAQLVGYIQEVKRALPDMTITYADVWEFWNKHPEVAPAVDRVTIHILPYWEDKPISVDQAINHVRNIRDQMQRALPGKEIVIGETGWPSFGRMREGALPSAENQAIFTRNFVQTAEKEGWKYNFIEAFDQPWKRVSEGAVGGYWGLFDADRHDKHVLHGFVSNYPHAQWLFIASFVLSLMALPWLVRIQTCACKKASYWFMLLFGGSIALVWQANQYWYVSRNMLEYGWAILCLLVAFVLLRQIVRALILEEGIVQGSMQRAIGVLSWQIPFTELRLNDLVHLLSVSILLVMALALAFDGRYMNFEMGTLGIIALSYVIQFFSYERKEANGLLEKASGLALYVCAIAVLLHESARNDFALNWVVLMVLAASMLWLSSSKLCGISKPFAILIVSALGMIVLKEKVYLDESWIDVCAQTPGLLTCQFRTLLGKAIYFNYVGLAGIAVALFGLVSSLYWIGLLAMVMGLFCLLTFNGFLGAIIVSLGWWIVGFHLGNQCSIAK